MGRTWDVLNRFNGYSKNSAILLLLRVKDGYHVEYDLLYIFNKKFKNIEKCGKEYFNGNINEMIEIVKKYVSDTNQVIEENDNNQIRENYKKHLKFKINDKDAIDDYLTTIIFNNFVVTKLSSCETNDEKNKQIIIEIENNDNKKLIDITSKKENLLKWKFDNFVIKNVYYCDKCNDTKTEIRIEIKEKFKKETDENKLRAALPKITRINEYLKIPENEIENNKQLFNDKQLLSKHFNITTFFYSSENENMKKLDKRQDYDIIKCKDIKIKLALLNNMLNKLNLDKNNIGAFIPTLKKIDGYEKIKNDYLKLFRCRDKDLKFDTDLEMYKAVCKIYQQLFGITTIKKKNIKIAIYNLHLINEEELEYHNKIYQYRKHRNNENNVNDENKKNIMNNNCKLSMDKEKSNEENNKNKDTENNKTILDNLVKECNCKKVKINEENENEEAKKIIIKKKIFNNK